MIQIFTLYPCEALRPYVHHYWVMRVAGEVISETIIPPASMKWIFHRLNPFTINDRPDASRTGNVCLTYGQSVHVYAENELDMICVFFQPYASRIVLQMPCEELAGRLDTLDNLDDKALAQLKRRELDADSNDEALCLIEAFLLERIYSAPESPYLKQLQHVAKTIAINPNIRAEQLAGEACLCERQFRTIFKENYGISPKQFLRFNRFMYLHRLIIANPNISLKELVFEGDFTDYSHINKDFLHFVGLPPSEMIELIKQVVQSSDADAYRSYYRAPDDLFHR